MTFIGYHASHEQVSPSGLLQAVVEAERLGFDGAFSADHLAPCVIVAGEVLIGAREMRTMGIEAAYPIRVSSLDHPTGGDLTADEIAQAAVRVARSWHW